MNVMMFMNQDVVSLILYSLRKSDTRFNDRYWNTTQVSGTWTSNNLLSCKDKVKTKRKRDYVIIITYTIPHSNLCSNWLSTHSQRNVNTYWVARNENRRNLIFESYIVWNREFEYLLSSNIIFIISCNRIKRNEKLVIWIYIFISFNFRPYCIQLSFCALPFCTNWIIVNEAICPLINNTYC